MVTETTAERGFSDWAKTNGWKIIKVTSPGRKGRFDRVYLKQGLHVWIEWKHPDGSGTLSHHQREELQDLVAHGAHAAVFNDKDKAIAWVRRVERRVLGGRA